MRFLSNVKVGLQAVMFIVGFGTVGVVKACDGWDYDFEVQVTADLLGLCLANEPGYEDYKLDQCHVEFAQALQYISETQALINSSTPVDQHETVK